MLVSTIEPRVFRTHRSVFKWETIADDQELGLEHLAETQVSILEVEGICYQGLSELHLAAEWRTHCRVEGGGSKITVDVNAVIQVRFNWSESWLKRWLDCGCMS